MKTGAKGKSQLKNQLRNQPWGAACLLGYAVGVLLLQVLQAAPPVVPTLRHALALCAAGMGVGVGVGRVGGNGGGQGAEVRARLLATRRS